MNFESQDIKQQKLDELKKIFPEIFEDKTINYKKLKDILNDEIEEGKAEHYSFNWFGKKDCYKTIKAKTNATLKVDEDKDIPNGDNVFIEGDNLEVLKLLQHSYHKKVKMIYIDPPYNKDKDFVYKDTWSDTIQNYKIQTDQLRDGGYTSTKTSSSGRRHTNWLNMIYPRLWLSRNLLKDDGVIFVSIDDDEVHNLRKVMDEIYGEENFVAQIVWRKTDNQANIGNFARVKEYILMYAKNIYALKINQMAMTERAKKEYRYKDNIGFFRRKILLDKTRAKNYYEIKTPSGKILAGPWMIKEENFIKLREDNKIYWAKGGEEQPYGKLYLKDKNGQIPNDFLGIEFGTNQEGGLETEKLLVKRLFDFPKPISLIKHFIRIGSSQNDIILDFFAGSGTTAHAVMELNQEDNGNRKYILVQLPEATDEKSEAYKNGYKKISDITKERLKRVIKKLDYKDGFKSFYLDDSNFQIFKEVKKRPNESLEDIEKMLKMSIFNENILTQGAKELDIVYEIGLKNGFSLSAITEDIKTDKYNFIRLFEEDREFYFCFDKEIQNSIIKDIPKECKLICYEKALTDSVKLNLHTNIDLETL